MDRAIEHRFRELSHLIGNTPLLVIEMLYRGQPRRVYAKAEHLNLTGSVKDRMASHVLRSAYERGELTPGAPIAEVTSGNTGISFAAIGRALGHPVTIFMPDWLSRERTDLIRSFGADCRLVSQAEGGFPACIELADRFAKENPGCFLPRQFSNFDNSEAHELTTGPEIWWQLRFVGLEPDGFVAGVGTGGTVMGVGAYLRAQKPTVSVHPLEPLNSPTLRVGHKVGSHRIQGISDEFVPPILDLAALDEILEVDDGDAIIMAQRLGRELGLGVGLSSGANLLGALMVQDRLGDDAVVATVFADDNKKYLSTSLLRDEPVGDRFMSPEIELRGFRAIKRACTTCCDGPECTRFFAEDGAPLPVDCPRRTTG
ncbi:MAG: PLP-dependent cysteine synthase family protein [Actinomycetota bacterium]|nr:PLP-dependent cysteine synthase family protein [Actinomycetota bacterium]